MELPDSSHPKKRGLRGPALTPALQARLRKYCSRHPAADPKELVRVVGYVVRPATMKEWCRKLGLSYKRYGRLNKLTPGIEKRLRAFVAKHPSAYPAEIAQALDNIVCPGTIWSWCKRLELSYRTAEGRTQLTPKIEKRLRALLAAHPSPYYRGIIRAIGKKYDRRTIKSWCRKLGILYRPLYGNQIRMTPDIESRLRQILSERPEASCRAIARAMDGIVSPKTIKHWSESLDPSFNPHSRTIRKLTPEIEQRLREQAALHPSADCNELARAMDDLVRPSTITRWCKKLGITLRRNQYRPKSRMTPEVEQRLRGLVAERPSAAWKELADSMGALVGWFTIKKWCKQLDLPIVNKSRLTRELKERLLSYLNKNPSATYKAIAEAFQIPAGTLPYLMIHTLGLPRRHRPRLSLDEQERLRTLVAQKPLATYPELARELQFSITKVTRWVRRLGLPH